MPNKQFYEKHEGSIISGIGFLVFVLAGAVITNFVSTELEKERSKEEDAKYMRDRPKIEKIEGIEKYAKDTREWVRVINDRNVSQLQMINDLKIDLAKIKAKQICLHKEK